MISSIEQIAEDLPSDEISIALRTAYSTGDEQSWEKVHGYIDGLSRSHLNRMPEGEREDLVQRSALRLFNSKGYNPSRPAKPYIYTIIRRTFKDMLMEKNADKRSIITKALSYDRPISNGEGASFKDFIPAKPIYDPSESKKTARDLVINSHSLNASEREVLEIIYLRDKTLKVASTILGMPIGTIKSKVSRALKKLRDQEILI